MCAAAGSACASAAENVDDMCAADDSLPAVACDSGHQSDYCRYDTGSLVAIGNIYRDAPGQRESSGSTYSAFNPSDFYAYSLDPAGEVEALLTKCAGPRPTLGQ